MILGNILEKFDGFLIFLIPQFRHSINLFELLMDDIPITNLFPLEILYPDNTMIVNFLITFIAI